MPPTTLQPPAVEKIIEIVEATLGSHAKVRQEKTNGTAVVLKSSRLTFAVFFAEEFVADYPAHERAFDAKLLRLPERIKASSTRAVFIDAAGDIEDFESELVFA